MAKKLRAGKAPSGLLAEAQSLRKGRGGWKSHLTPDEHEELSEVHRAYTAGELTNISVAELSRFLIERLKLPTTPGAIRQWLTRSDY